MRSKIILALAIASMITPRPSQVSTISLAARAASVASATAIPMSVLKVPRSLQGGCVVHAVARHAYPVAVFLEYGHDLVFVLGEDLGEAVAALDQFRQLELCNAGVRAEDVGVVDHGTHIQLATRLAGDRGLVAWEKTKDELCLTT